MTKSQALKEARRRFGPDAVVLDERRLASTPERRAEAREKLKELNALCTTHELRKQHRKERDHWLSESYRYRFKVAVHHGFCIGIRGSGDTWEEAFADSDKLYAKAA